MGEKEFCRKVGSIIRKLRCEKCSDSLCVFAEKNNIPSSTLSRIEIGENEAQLHNLKKIADGLGMSLSALFAYIEASLAK
ncbi:TPA: helix-turn-helix transcriptional regulator [Candidatus Scatousia excrementigallinarum]|uniref:Helix-turn-helix transcriptional regulator n=1 Tax=Candidatus Scatousia excrementigallinarum TaxID=2840935 RepID=A0A9D1JPI9_9BACT|nr:helix-turn-helix transcriptional regulator [Candidatus Scatousia excrementigallinarum]